MESSLLLEDWHINDYWVRFFKTFCIIDSGADLISYGMGKRSILEIAEALNRGEDISTLHHIAGTVYHTKEAPVGGIILPSYEEMCADKKKLPRVFRFSMKIWKRFQEKYCRVLRKSWVSGTESSLKAVIPKRNG